MEESKQFKPDIVLNHSDKTTRTNIVFGNLVTLNIDGLQEFQELSNHPLHEVTVMYEQIAGSKTGVFEIRKFYLEPLYQQDVQTARSVDVTKQYYMDMGKRSSGKGILKGFFKKEVATDPTINQTNYLGYLIYDEEEQKYMRDKDHSFDKKYSEYQKYLEKKNIMEKYFQESAFVRDLQEKADNHETHYKTSHAEVLYPKKQDGPEI